MEALNILWKIVPKSQGIIGILRVIAEGGPRYHRQLEIGITVSYSDSTFGYMQIENSDSTSSTYSSLLYPLLWYSQA